MTTTTNFIKKSFIVILLVCSIIATDVKAQRGPSYFKSGKCELGMTFGLNMGAAFFGKESEWDMRTPFLPILGLDLGLNFSYSLTDWMKIALPVEYSINASVYDDDNGEFDESPFGIVGMAKLPVIVAFKVLNGHIGIGFQQNLTLHKASKFRDIDFNASCIILDFGVWSPWVFVGSSGYTDFYPKTTEGAVGYLRFGYSLNKIGTENRKSHYYFLSWNGRLNFLEKSTKKSTKRRRI